MSDDTTVTYGVTADNSAFEQAMRALNLAANNSPMSDTTLKEALDLATSAVNATAEMQAQLGVASSSIQAASADVVSELRQDAWREPDQCGRRGCDGSAVHLSGAAYGILCCHLEDAEPESSELPALSGPVTLP